MAISFDDFKRKKEAAEAAVNESIKEKFVAAAQKLKSLEASKKRGSAPQQTPPQGNAQTSNFDDADDGPEDPFDSILHDLDLFTDPNGIGYATIKIDRIYRNYKIGQSSLKRMIKVDLIYHDFEIVF